MSYGVLVGRFQVNALHDGHRELFNQVAERHKRVIVFVGVNPGGISLNHPLDFITREKMIKAEYPDFIVLPLDDMRGDPEWSDQLDAEIKKVVKGNSEVTLYGGRDSFVPHYTGRFKPLELNLPPKITAIKGTDIRRECSDNVIASADFRAGMIYASAQGYPILFPTVDIAALYQSEDKLELLLGRRANETKWRFPGGFAEARTKSFEEDARRELFEETHVSLDNLTYVGSANIPDWRYAATPDRKLRTLFFRGYASSLSATAGDDLAEVKWFDVSKLQPAVLVEEHSVLYHMLMLNLRKEKTLHADTVSA